ncbi:hypothetical protein KVT40_001332 [Elsinoe batatas]|uniref:Erythromycin biosynthesis protein CIII-like C-terminal domain-containing protein n=1 Tax=Elsinoe batatas TaxID=2601811 RepID=A0A8K0PJN7_9PEZI|nr:hypothetical protein KVT40_001332 [Elsinoe batatas]
MESAPKTVLFLTSPEYGQANVVLATAQELAKAPECNVYVASFASLQQRVDDINARNKNLAKPITFVNIPGLSAVVSAQRQLGDTSTWAHPPGFLPAAKSYKGVEYLLMGDSPAGYIQTYHACLQIMKHLKPAAVICDLLLIPAHDATRELKLDYIIISPCSGKEVVGTAMPGMPMMFKWPMQSSGMSYPLSTVQKLKNVALFMCFAYSVILGPTFAKIRKARAEAGIKHQSPMYDMYQKRHLYIASHLPEADWDELRETPSNLVVCGPIIMPSLEDDTESGKDLLKWLSQRPTVMVNLGSLQGAVGPSSVAIARGLQKALDLNKEIQILWKLKYDWPNDRDMAPLLNRHVEAGRLRIISWLETEPSTLLQTGYICCSVHHGGANSFYEACRAGVPQLVVPIWWDTYEYAERAKYHRIGAIGNPGVAPSVDPDFFGSELVRVLGDDDIKRRATEVGAACGRRGEGREIAADAILKWMHGHVRIATEE